MVIDPSEPDRQERRGDTDGRQPGVRPAPQRQLAWALWSAVLVLAVGSVAAGLGWIVFRYSS